MIFTKEIRSGRRTRVWGSQLRRIIIFASKPLRRTCIDHRSFASVGAGPQARRKSRACKLLWMEQKKLHLLPQYNTFVLGCASIIIFWKPSLHMLIEHESTFNIWFSFRCTFKAKKHQEEITFLVEKEIGSFL